MEDVVNTVNSTNEQFEATSNDLIFKKSKKLEKKPLIGEKGGMSTAANNEHGALGSSPAISTALAEDSSVQLTASDYSLDGLSEEGGSPNLAPQRTLNTTDGVFAPVALSQFSSLLFLRVGYLVGNGGLLLSLGLLLGCYFILFLTVLSICAISTNGAIEGGGAYFMISRTLGPEMGGAIGIVFYIANVFSCALYTSGCVEGIIQGITTAMNTDPVNASAEMYNNATGFEMSGGETYGLSLGINMLLLCVCIIGAKLFGKCTNLFFITVSSIAVLVLIALLARSNIIIPYAHSSYTDANMTKHAGNFTGPSLDTVRSNLFQHYNIDYTNGNQIHAMTLFGVLFSGVTGITSGANMSGELRNPGYSIPRGTIFALIFTFGMYCCLFTATAFSTSTDVLQFNYVFMGYVSFWQPLVYVGIVLATICASLSNMIGASRVLRAVADDRVFGPMFDFLSPSCGRAGGARSTSSGGICSCLTHNEFLGPLLLTFVLSAGLLAIGDMNSIAPFASVFFLLSYAMINLSCIMLSWAAAPNFRPKFKHFNLLSCGLGLLTTVAVMIKLNVVAAFTCFGVFMLLLICLYFYHLKYPSAEIQWGSVAQAVLFHTVRKYLLKLDFRREHVKFWRPHVLLLVANPRTACPLIDFLNDLKKSGIYILGHVKVSNKSPCDLSEEYNRWQELVDHLKVKAFVSVTESSSLRAGALQMVRVSGLGALKPNTVVLGFRDSTPPTDFLTMESSRYILRPSKSKSIPSNWHPIQDRRGPDAEASPARDRLPERLSLHDYVALLNDILKAGKNLALCRHFETLDKEQIVRRRNQRLRYIDVWPINFMCPETSSLDDTASLFTLQLGTILNMVKFWSKNTKYRVFLIEPFEWSPDFLLKQQIKVKETLASVRMNAEIVSVPWKAPSKMASEQLEGVVVQAAGLGADEAAAAGDVQGAAGNSAGILTSSTGSGGSNSSSSSKGDLTSEQLPRLTDRYIGDVNRTLRTHSSDAAVMLINILPPPSDPAKYSAYIDVLSTMSNDVGPCVMVHGVSKVTTTML